MSVEALRSVVDVLGSNQGIITMTLAALVGLGSPILDRLVIRRKRVQYQVVYNSKIGLSPVFLEPDGDRRPTPAHMNPELTHLAHQLEKLSVMIIRIRNAGSADIEEPDIQPPLSVTFGNRIVWDARISEASDDQLRQHIRENLQFFTNPDAVRTEPQRPADDFRSLGVVRRWLARRLADAVTPEAGDQQAEPEPQWHGVRLANLWMRRKQSFILVVVLHEAESHAAAISKEYEVTGGHGNGRTIIDQRKQGWFRWPVVATAIGVILVGALVGTILARVIVGAQPTAAPDVPCAPGQVNVAGSSAFGPIVQKLGDTYMSKCPGATVTVDSSGSLDGVRALTGDPQRTDLAALSDGATDEPTTNLDKRLVAVLIYTMVINKDVGIDQLTSAQLAGIYNGTYTNWHQLGGADLPIQIVGRGESSGTRRAFERYVLRGSEGVLSSDDCMTKDRITSAPTIRCERDTTDELIAAVQGAPGGIGYADVATQSTKDAVRGGSLVTVRLDGRYPQVDSLPEYPFWTVEYLYTRGSTLGAFVSYLNSDSAQAVLLSAGYTPCVPRSGVLNPLCSGR